MNPAVSKLARALGSALIAAAATHAATVSFQTPTTITSDTALDTAWNGGANTLVQAVSFGLTATVTTGGGQTIAFTSGADVGDFDIPASSGTGAGVHNGNLQNDTYAGTTGDTNFDTVLGSNAWHTNTSDATRPLTVRIGNLTPGQNYVVSLFTADDRAGSAGRTQAYWAGFSAGTFSGGTSGSFSQTSPTIVIGTFTADASGYQDIFIEETDNAGNADTHFAGYTLYATPNFVHPSIPNSLDELATIKNNLDKEPWKSGYALLAADSKSQLTYTMQGPFATVTRNPDLNRWAWMSDMEAVYNLTLMWYFTGNDDYAIKARGILIAWATTQTTMGGQESGLMLGDYAYRYAGAASILRGGWSGWTAADTATVKNYFANVFWPATAASTNVPGPANKGLLNMVAGIAIAAFCDDTAKFNRVIDQYRTYPGAGLENALPIGEMGEVGRDAGHLYGGLLSMAFISEVAWKQGIDLYSELDNRLLACGEYYARNTLTLDTPFVPYGTVDALYWTNANGPYPASRAAFYLLQNAYKNRKNLPTPWIDRKLQDQNVDGNNFIYAKTADFTTATPPGATVRPPVSLASSGLTLTTLGNNSAGSSVSHSNGVWTMTGRGNGVWTGTGGSDDCQFAYKQMTGDCAMVAKVTSFTNSGTQSGKCGLMLRDNLSATVSQRGLVDASWHSSGSTAIECRQDGWTENWGGSYFASRSYNSPLGLPYWLKIERRGTLINTYSSQDGTSWSAMVSADYPNLPSTLYIGLFLCSGNTTSVTATFENVAFTGGTGGLVTTPAAPATVLASGSNKAITVRWLASSGATAYDVLRSTTSGSGYTALASNLTADKTSYVDTTASAGTTYYYVVRAKNSAGTSGNSSQFGAALLPAPMANLAFGGTTDANINVGPQVGGSDTAFDGDPGSKWYGWNSPTGWLQYDFGAGNEQVVKRYTINSADVPSRDPKDWQFQGSQDGSTWTTLDTQSGQSFAIVMAQNTYGIGNTTAYRYYRLNITANNGATGVAISELGLWGDTGRTIPDGTYRIVTRHSNKLITASNGGTANGTELVQWGNGGGNEQKWTLTHLGNGQYQVTGVASGRVMDVSNNSTSNGAKLHLWNWLNNNNQKWTVTPAGDGSFKFTAVHSGKVADVSGASTADGANVHQWSDLGADNQQWRMSPTAP